MTISRKMLLITGALIATIGMMQARSMKNFDTATLNPYIARAQEAITKGKDAAYYHVYVEEVAVDNYEKLIYSYQKFFMKTIARELKQTAKDLKKSDKIVWLPARQLYKAFKHDVYKNWKKTQLLLGEQQNSPVVLE